MNLCHTIVLNFVEKWNSEFKMPRWNNLSPYSCYTELKICGKYAKRIEWNIWQRRAIPSFSGTCSALFAWITKLQKIIDHKITFQTHTKIELLDSAPTRVCKEFIHHVRQRVDLRFVFFRGNFSCDMNNNNRQVTSNFMNFSNIRLYWKLFPFYFTPQENMDHILHIIQHKWAKCLYKVPNFGRK